VLRTHPQFNGLRDGAHRGVVAASATTQGVERLVQTDAALTSQQALGLLDEHSRVEGRLKLFVGPAGLFEFGGVSHLTGWRFAALVEGHAKSPAGRPGPPDT
jgi:hypothetical protein